MSMTPAERSCYEHMTAAMLTLATAIEKQSDVSHEQARKNVEYDYDMWVREVVS